MRRYYGLLFAANMSQLPRNIHKRGPDIDTPSIASHIHQGMCMFLIVLVYINSSTITVTLLDIVGYYLK